MRRVLLDENNIIINITECSEDNPLENSYDYFSWNKIGEKYLSLSDKLLLLKDNLDDTKEENNESITNLELALCEAYENSDSQLTDLQMALCEVYELLQGGTT